jgi:predicted AlkP superfamily pyrophosphatase or phosphodiesterase
MAAGLLARPSLQAEQADAPHVVIISIDGLKPSTYLDSGPSKVPTLRQLAKDGASAEVIGVTPTLSLTA